LTEKLHAVDPNEPSVSSLRRLAEDECEKTCKNLETPARVDYSGRPFNCLKCLPDEVSIPKCQCCYSMFLDATLLCAGTSSKKRSMFDQFRCFIEENVLVYSVAINSWLERVPPEYYTWLKNARYVSKDSASETAEKVHSSLGEKDEANGWLAACLLKTIRDNQRWHKGTELIDNFPEAVSWFKEML